MRGLGFDIGSYEVKSIVFDFEKNKVIYFDKVKTKGFQKGKITKKLDLKETVEKIVFNLENNLETRFEKAIVGFVSPEFIVKKQKEFVMLNQETVREEDLGKFLGYSKKGNFLANREIVEIFPLTYFIDQIEVQDPIGKRGNRLDIEFLVIDGPSFLLQEINDIFSSYFSSFKIKFSSLASAYFYTTEKDKDIGTLFFDFGHETSTLVLFSEGKCLEVKILPIGSFSLTKDLASALRINIEDAEYLKTRYGSFGSKKISKKEKIQSELGDFSLKEISRILELRYEDILEEIEKFLKETNFHKKLPGGILISGGGAKIGNIVSFTKEKTKRYVKKILPNEFFDSDQDYCEFSNLIAMLNLERNSFEKFTFLDKIKKFLGF